MTYWQEDPYKAGAPLPPDLLEPLSLPVETAYLQHVAAQVALDWSTLGEMIPEGEWPNWLLPVMGKLETVVDDLGELLVYLDANMPKDLAAVDQAGDVDEAPPALTVVPDPPAEDVATPPAPAGEPDPRWRCTTCGEDAENPVAHEDAAGHWPTYANAPV